MLKINKARIEPSPNGDRINMGTYGSTMRATKTVSGWWGS